MSPLLTRLFAVAGPILLLFLTALAGYAYSQVRFLSLPIPQALGLFTVVLPLITGITTQGVFGLTRRARGNNQYGLSTPLIVIIGFQLIYETIIATLALTHILPPSELACGLNGRWAALYSKKDGRAVKAIQDTFNCCGFRTVWDRAYPFRNNAHDPGNCADYFHRSESCFGQWRQAEQINAGLFLVVAIVVFFVKVFSLVNILTGSSLVPAGWVRAFKQHRRHNGNDLDDDRTVTGRLIADGEYHDAPTDGTPNGTRTLDAPNGNGPDQGPRLEPSQLIDGGNQWRNEEGGERVVRGSHDQDGGGILGMLSRPDTAVSKVHGVGTRTSEGRYAPGARRHRRIRRIHIIHITPSRFTCSHAVQMCADVSRRADETPGPPGLLVGQVPAVRRRPFARPWNAVECRVLGVAKAAKRHARQRSQRAPFYSVRPPAGRAPITPRDKNHPSPRGGSAPTHHPPLHLVHRRPSTSNPPTPTLLPHHDRRMRENLGTASRARAEWSASPQKARKRRDSRLANHQTIRTARIATATATATTPTSPDAATGASSFQIYLQHSPEQQLNLDFYEFQTSPPERAGLNPATATATTHDGQQTAGSWFPPFPGTNLPTALTTSLPNVDIDNISPLDTSVSPIDFGNSLNMPWAVANPAINNVNPGIDEMYIPGSRYGSFESMALSANTAPSPISEGYVLPTPGYSLGNPEQSQFVCDLALTNQYYRGASHEPPYSSPTTLASPSFSDERLSESDLIPIPISAEWNYAEMYPPENISWPTNTYTVEQQAHNPEPERIPIRSRAPWNSHDAQVSDFAQDATPGVVAFEPSRGAPYEVFEAREELLQQAPGTNQVFGPEPPDDNESWQMVPSYANSFSSQSPQLSHDSPKSHHSPHSHDSPSSDFNTGRHPHVIFSSFPGVRKTKQTRGRLRPLTTQEKREAREVREVGACWACHLSKIKCSPCSLGSPCEQCTRLDGKRRFCLLSCFNDPIETLNQFMVPDYLMGHFTQANVEAFLDRSRSCWGNQMIRVRLNWGHQRSLEADVVALTVGDCSSDLNFQHHAIFTGTGRPTFSRQKSPPLGIPLAGMVDMQDSYSSYVQELVRNDLSEYIATAYDDQKSRLPELLLKAACTFYEGGLGVGDECELLRQALEMHVTSTILERSLILDRESINMVQNHLQQNFPARSAPRCAQRQIKLAFFFIHRQRIMEVLKRWGMLMWTSNNSISSEYKWAIGFSVFLVLILVIDKTLGAAYLCCEGRIKNYGREAAAERAEFQKLVMLTQRELFERCREIFHSRFKTRKAGKESCNPIRDGRGAFRGREVDDRIMTLVYDMNRVVHESLEEIRSNKTSRINEYTDSGRLASIFLDDFLEH
ncbi:hypothetical protein B7494_g5497 [Chlorociboria aeruginascens]|nr:hypothetical protein B7494_g5497 [Chlorociboria aeruginascens]